MLIDKIPAGDSVPEVLNAIIEISAHAAPVKYEIAKSSGAVFVDRFINVPMHYPCNYGFIPQTLSEDGDPLDVLVVTPVPVLTGSVVPCRPVDVLEISAELRPELCRYPIRRRPVDVLEMSDEAGRDLKLLAVPTSGMNGGYDDVESADDLPPGLLDQIVHFFENYKSLEPDKWVKVENWLGVEEARRQVLEGVKRFYDGAEEDVQE